jgi:hypothetical protein
MRFIPYSPDQGYLLPPNVHDIWGGGTCAFLSAGWWTGSI